MGCVSCFSQKNHQNKVQCSSNYTELLGIDIKLLWGQTVYMNLWQSGGLKASFGKEIIEIGSKIKNTMIAKFLEICKEHLEGGLDFVQISQDMKKKIEFIFGSEWLVTISKKDDGFKKSESQNEERIRLKFIYLKKNIFINILNIGSANDDIQQFSYPLNKLENNEQIEYFFKNPSSLTRNQLFIIGSIVLKNTRLYQNNLSQLTQFIKQDIDTTFCPFWSVFVVSKETMIGTFYQSYNNKEVQLVVNNLLYLEIFQQQ
eukprot:TRINITY_DN843_c0_g1_i4.p1 TRINITY_DN843_c0_g1~~TRINITY_DN843_c0_g1_i4.p1  ORF type:complete len:259 (-),score=38.66 TRINITY_DN843_c0_g1_i4:40-816(-)